MPRTLSFDPEEKLKTAMLLFWKNGYEGTSIGDLIAALEINRFSLYKQFGDKHALFEQCLRYYNERVFQPVLEPLRSARPGKSAIDEYLQNFNDKVSSKRAALGCLLMNTLTAGDKVHKEFQPILNELLSDLSVLIKRNLDAAKKQGELNQSPEDCHAFMLMSIQALLLTRKTLGKEAFLTNVEFFRAMVKNW